MKIFTQLTKKEKLFIDYICEGYGKGESYLNASEQLGEKLCTTKSANVLGSKMYSKLKLVIQDRLKESFDKQKEERLERKLQMVEKAEKVQENQELVNTTFNKTATADEIIVSKNPVLFNSLLNLGIVKCLFDEVKLNDNKKELLSAEINRGAWLAMPFVKDLIARNMLNKDMFEYKAKSGQMTSAVANQVNVNVNNK